MLKNWGDFRSLSNLIRSKVKHGFKNYFMIWFLLLWLASINESNQEIPTPSPHSTHVRICYPALGPQNSVTNAQTSKSHFLFPSRYCAAMHGYQVPLFSANPLTKHSFQFNQDNTARWMASASWVFLGKGQRGNGVFLNKKYPHHPLGFGLKVTVLIICGPLGPIQRGQRLRDAFRRAGSRLVYRANVWKLGMRLCESAACVPLLVASAHKWPPEFSLASHW